MIDQERLFRELGEIQGLQKVTLGELKDLKSRVSRLERFKAKVLGMSAVASAGLSYVLSRMFPSHS